MAGGRHSGMPLRGFREGDQGFWSCAAASVFPVCGLELPCNLGVRAPFDLRWIHEGKVIVKFQVMVLQEILSDGSKLRALRNTPSQLSIQPRVGAYCLRGQSADEVGVRVPGKMAGEIETRSELGLMCGAGTLIVRRGASVLAVGGSVDVHLEEGIARAKRPAIRNLPVERGFDALCCAVEIVGDHVGNNQEWGQRPRTDERRARFDTFQLLILVEEG
jgi:hypothetical protein